MSYEFIALLMFLTMFVTLLSGRHIYAVIGGVASIFAIALWGSGGMEMGFHASFKLINWYPMVTLPIFCIYRISVFRIKNIRGFI